MKKLKEIKTDKLDIIQIEYNDKSKEYVIFNNPNLSDKHKNITIKKRNEKHK